jgi:E3 ubiquitin-protein ligase BRE1
MFDLAIHVSPVAQPNMKKVMEKNSEATQQLVTKFVQLSGPNNFPPSRHEMYAKAQEAQTQVRDSVVQFPPFLILLQRQCIALRSELDIMRAESQNSANEMEALRAALRSAEGRVDRLRSKTIQAMEAQTPAAKQEVKQEESDESHPVQPSPPEVSGLANWWESILMPCLHPLTHIKPPTENESSSNLKELEILQDTIKAHHTEINELEREKAELRDQNFSLAMGVRNFSLS